MVCAVVPFSVPGPSWCTQCWLCGHNSGTQSGVAWNCLSDAWCLACTLITTVFIVCVPCCVTVYTAVIHALLIMTDVSMLDLLLLFLCHVLCGQCVYPLNLES